MAVYDTPFRIRVPWDVGTTSKNKKTAASYTRQGDRAFRALMQRSYEAARLAWMEAGCPESRYCVRVIYLIRRLRKLDDDGALYGISKIRDALFVDAITPEDGANWIVYGGITWETGESWRGREEVIVTVEPMVKQLPPKQAAPKDPAEEEKKLQQKALQQALRGR